MYLSIEANVYTECIQKKKLTETNYQKPYGVKKTHLKRRSSIVLGFWFSNQIWKGCHNRPYIEMRLYLLIYVGFCRNSKWENQANLPHWYNKEQGGDRRVEARVFINSSRYRAWMKINTAPEGSEAKYVEMSYCWDDCTIVKSSNNLQEFVDVFSYSCMIWKSFRRKKYGELKIELHLDLKSLRQP